MKVKIKTEVVEKYLKDNHLTKNSFSKNCYISVKTFDRFMAGEDVVLIVGLKMATYMKLEYADLFDFVCK